MAHGEFGDWLKGLGLHERTAQQMMKVASDESLKASTYTHLGTRALYEISTMPESERDKPHELKSGETKTPQQAFTSEMADS